MRDIFRHGFETGTSGWTVVPASIPGQLEISADYNPKHHGSRSCRFTLYNGFGVSAVCRLIKTVAAMSEWYWRAYLYIANLALNDGVTKRIMGQDNAANAATGGGLGIRNNAGTYEFRTQYRSGGVNISSYHPVEAGRWYCCELYFLINAGAGIARIWIDNVLKVEATGIDNSDRGNAEKFQVGFSFTDAGDVSGTMSLYWDCCILSDLRVGCDRTIIPLKTLGGGRRCHTNFVYNQRQPPKRATY